MNFLTFRGSFEFCHKLKTYIVGGNLLSTKVFLIENGEQIETISKYLDYMDVTPTMVDAHVKFSDNVAYTGAIEDDNVFIFDANYVAKFPCFFKDVTPTVYVNDYVKDILTCVNGSGYWLCCLTAFNCDVCPHNKKKPPKIGLVDSELTNKYKKLLNYRGHDNINLVGILTLCAIGTFLPTNGTRFFLPICGGISENIPFKDKTSKFIKAIFDKALRKEDSRKFIEDTVCKLGLNSIERLGNNRIPQCVAFDD